MKTGTRCGQALRRPATLTVAAHKKHLLNRSAVELLTDDRDNFVAVIKNHNGIFLRPLWLPAEVIDVVRIPQSSTRMAHIPLTKLNLQRGVYDLIWSEGEGLARLVEVKR